MKKEESKIEELIEKYRLWIGGVLILAIVCGSAVLIWRENYQTPSLEDRLTRLEEKNIQLEAEIKKQDTSNKEQTNLNIQNSNTQTEQGQVAGTSSQSTESSAKSKVVTGKININTATEEQLISLPEIGPATAKKIMDYRTLNGPFKTIDGLDNVKGIGVKTIDAFRELVTVN